ncbi:chromobox protein homolog 5-like isoform X2 [Pseudomyrmex gracilis]|nr:chromobox protein homolog 5-like isoform X2 [Pseudomyrmex gracilis]
MRRLSMRNKRKSEATSEDESEENGVNNGGTPGKNNKTSTVRKSVTKRHSASRSATDDNAEAKNPSDEPEKERENGQKTSPSQKSSPNKRKKKEDKAASTSSHDKSSDDEDEYEVEKLVNLRTIKGRRQFLVRWKGYGESADTWENEKDLNCPNLIQEYLEEEKDKEFESQNISVPKTSKTKKSKGTPKKDTEDGEEHKKDEKDSENAKEFEVEKIIEVHFKKNGTREFLIRWKGFSPAHDSWEPESNLNCPYLISRFMEKLEKVKTADMRELRTNRVHTKRYTLSTHDAGRRLSKRNRDKQR